MVSAKKLIQMAKTWQRMAVRGRRRLTIESKLSYQDSDQSTSPRAEKGHFVVYTIDKKRIMIPLDFLNTKIVMQLFHLSEEEFGYTADGPIKLPCEAAFIEYVMDLVKRGVSEEVEGALLSSIFLPPHQSCSAGSKLGISQPVEICGF